MGEFVLLCLILVNGGLTNCGQIIVQSWNSLGLD